MRAWLAPWLVFTVGLALATDRLFAGIVIPHSVSTAAKLRRLLESSDPREVAVFGSSRAEGDVVPSELGEHVYNYGLSGTEFDVTEVLLEIELTKARSSPLIINFDPDFFGVTSIGDVYTFVPSCDDPAIVALLRRAGAYHVHYRVPGARFYGAYEEYLKAYLSGFQSPTKEFDRGAALEKNRLGPERFAAMVALRRQARSTFDLAPDKDARFQALLDRRPERRIVVVFAPFHASFYERFDLPKLLDYLAHLERAHPNVTALFFDGRGLDDRLFYDTAHLNAAGAREFSRLLRLRLLERGIAL